LVTFNNLEKSKNMDIETITDEIQSNGTRKINIGLRCYGELKLKLSNEAEALGLSLSEYCENILINRGLSEEESEAANKHIETLQEQVNRLNSQLALDTSAFRAELEKVKSENGDLLLKQNRLRQKIVYMADLTKLFEDPHLLELFEKIKGEKDVINASDGSTYEFTYSNPKDLLKAMIYSYKYKKP
jgi:hypothetical protein